MPILFTIFVYRTNVYWTVIHGIKRKPFALVVWNWYHFVAIAILHQPRPTDSADINTRLQLSDTSSISPMHGGFLLISRIEACVADIRIEMNDYFFKLNYDKPEPLIITTREELSLLYGAKPSNIDRLKCCQNNAVMIISQRHMFDHISPVLRELH